MKLKLGNPIHKTMNGVLYTAFNERMHELTDAAFTTKMYVQLENQFSTVSEQIWVNLLENA